MSVNVTRLKSLLLRTGLQSKNQPLFQFLDELVTELVDVNSVATASGTGTTVINTIGSLIGILGGEGMDGEDGLSIPSTGGSGGGGGTGISTQVLAGALALGYLQDYGTGWTEFDANGNIKTTGSGGGGGGGGGVTIAQVVAIESLRIL